jgi:hypothetical protein
MGYIFSIPSSEATDSLNVFKMQYDGSLAKEATKEPETNAVRCSDNPEVKFRITFVPSITVEISPQADMDPPSSFKALATSVSHAFTGSCIACGITIAVSEDSEPCLISSNLAETAFSEATGSADGITGNCVGSALLQPCHAKLVIPTNSALIHLVEIQRQGRKKQFFAKHTNEGEILSRG